MTRKPVARPAAFESALHNAYLRWYYYLAMGKFRRGGFVFVTQVGDHPPRHVHVYCDKRLVVKWDLDRGIEMKGKAERRVRTLIEQLRKEGLL